MFEGKKIKHYETSLGVFSSLLLEEKRHQFCVQGLKVWNVNSTKAPHATNTETLFKYLLHEALFKHLLHEGSSIHARTPIKGCTSLEANCSLL